MSTEFDAAVSAIRRMDVLTLEQLLADHPEIITQRSENPEERPNQTLLHFALGGLKVDDRNAPDRVALVKQLIEAGADVNANEGEGPTPLHYAAAMNLPLSAKALIEAGASLEATDHGDGGTPLAHALFYGAREAAAVIAAHGIHPHNLRIAAGLGDMELMRSYFDEEGQLTPEAGQHRAFYRPHEGWPAWMQMKGAQEVLDEAFCYACANDHVEAACFLLDHGAHVNCKPWFATGMHWAALHGHRSTVEFLVGKGANMEVHDDNWNSPPWGWADVHGYSEVSEYLLEIKESRELPCDDDVWT